MDRRELAMFIMTGCLIAIGLTLIVSSTPAPETDDAFVAGLRAGLALASPPAPVK